MRRISLPFWWSCKCFLLLFFYALVVFPVLPPAFVCLSFYPCLCFCFSAFQSAFLLQCFSVSMLVCFALPFLRCSAFPLFFMPFCPCLLVDFLLVCAFDFLPFRLAASLLCRFSACRLRSSAPPFFCFSLSLFFPPSSSGLVLLRFSLVLPSGFILLRDTTTTYYSCARWVTNN